MALKIDKQVGGYVIYANQEEFEVISAALKDSARALHRALTNQLPFGMHNTADLHQYILEHAITAFNAADKNPSA